jgi:hypothetical protein
MSGYRRIDVCRVCHSRHLVPALNLGFQTLTGVFPRDASEAITEGPIEVVWCPSCGLLQLLYSYDASEMYGENYGYRSGLNSSMVEHLVSKVRYLERLRPLSDGDVVLDIGSNDATTLRAYGGSRIRRIGVDPAGRKFASSYTADMMLVPEFFSTQAYHSVTRDRASIVTSIAMFYDLEDPIRFAQEVASVMTDEGIWHLEQSYMPSMLRLNSYDTICHEHLEYYSLRVIKRILEDVGLKVVDVTMNGINGGSFAITAARNANTTVKANSTIVEWLLEQEARMGLDTPGPFRAFEEKVFRHRDDLTRLVRGLVSDGKKVLGYGASTKGNVVLQFCGLSAAEIAAIADVNPDKHGRLTPGTGIPIVSEQDARRMAPDYFLVLPWHFKEGILRRERDFLDGGGRLIFPFPEIEIV